MDKTSIEDLERTYDKPDPWGYQTIYADLVRKNLILNRILEVKEDQENHSHNPWYSPVFESALDIGCGEGWITKELPAAEIYGYESSLQAKKRWSSVIKDLEWSYLRGKSKFDLVVSTGTLYENYDWEFFISMMNELASKYVVTSNIADREYWPAIEQIKGKLIHLEEFPYHRGPDEMFTQRLRIYRR